MAKPRSSNQLQRKRPAREPYDRVLIVCEGKKTEPTYFLDLVNRCRLSTANVKVIASGTEPRRLVDRAKEEEKYERQYGEQYDAVYCVFDRDEHKHFKSASENAQHAGFKLARSWPCFEYWLVMHFDYHRRPYGRSGDRTPARNCVRDLESHLSDYTKGKAGVYGVLESKLETAKSNAEHALSDAKETGRPNPSTEVHLLVAYLQKLAESDGGG